MGCGELQSGSSQPCSFTKAPLGEASFGLVMGECSDSKAHTRNLMGSNAVVVFLKWVIIPVWKYSSKFWQFLVATSHVSTLRDMNKWNKNFRFGGVGKWWTACLLHTECQYDRMHPVLLKCVSFFDARAQAHVMICLRLQVLPCDYLGVPLLWLMRHPIHISIMILMNITFWLINHWVKDDERRRFKPRCVMVSHTHTDRHTHTVNHETVSLP